jgi:hypothetical protein
MPTSETIERPAEWVIVTYQRRGPRLEVDSIAATD